MEGDGHKWGQRRGSGRVTGIIGEVYALVPSSPDPAHAGGTVWKVHYVTPGPSLSCSGDVTHHDPPLLFDLSRDPGELQPLSNDALSDTVLGKMAAAVRDHRATISPTPQQLTFYKALWKPWLQPCCGTFPLCGCTGEDF